MPEPTQFDGVSEAKKHRTFFEQLAARIPGFRGFLNRELRREVDQLQRETLAAELDRLRHRLRDLARDLTDKGELSALRPLERLDRRLDGVAQSIRFADYGASGLFDTVKIGEVELEKLYRFDLSLLDDLSQLGRAVDQASESSVGDVGASCAAVERFLADVVVKWSRRSAVISNVVKAPDAS
jgi:hypothetical protein